MRPTIYIAVIGLVAVLVALFLNFRETGTDVADGPAEIAKPQQTEPEVARPGVASDDSTSAIEQKSAADVQPSTSGPVDPPAEKAEQQQPPTYDIVRVNPKGDAVMAGRAAPGASVEIRDADKVIGTVKADQRGEWVFVPDKPLAPGNRELSLSSITEDGERRDSETIVVMAIPESAAAAKGASTTGVVVMPKEDVPASGTSKPGDAGAATSSSTPDRPAGDNKPVVQNPVVVELSRDSGQQAKILQGPKEGVRSGDLTLDSIDYNDSGDLNIQGQAPGGARVQLYLDNKFVGSSEARGDGQWSVTPEQAIPPGTYKLRVDQVQDGGAVRARLEIPFSRAEPIADLPEGSFVIVQPGNSLWRIARRTYGSGFNFVDIFRANDDQIGNPDLIYPGQIFTLPTAN